MKNILAILLIGISGILIWVLLSVKGELIYNIQKKKLFEIEKITYQCKVIPPLNVLR